MSQSVFKNCLAMLLLAAFGFTPALAAEALQTGRDLEAASNFAEAVQTYQSVWSEEAGFKVPEAGVRAGLCLERMENRSGAMQMYESVLRRAPRQLRFFQ